MREIKFRIFDNHEKRMVTNDVDSYISFLANGEVSHESLFGTTVLMQYTGLKDKNGKEIYESDIVKMLESGIHEKWASIKAVEFDNKYLGFSPFCYLNFIHSNNIVEVIGNIYENKELLK